MTLIPSDRLQRFQNELERWGRQTFPEASLTSIAAHFQEEAEELVSEVLGASPRLGVDRDRLTEELADCAILLMQMASWSGISLAAAIIRKHEINQQRQWGPSEGGYWKHKEDGGGQT